MRLHAGMDRVDGQGMSEKSPEEIDRLYRYWRVRVMYSMTTGYALYYFTRQNISMAAKPISDEFGFTNTQWGLVLSVSTIVYAFSKFFSGIVAIAPTLAT